MLLSTTHCNLLASRAAASARAGPQNSLTCAPKAPCRSSHWRNQCCWAPTAATPHVHCRLRQADTPLTTALSADQVAAVAGQVAVNRASPPVAQSSPPALPAWSPPHRRARQRKAAVAVRPLSCTQARVARLQPPPRGNSPRRPSRRGSRHYICWQGCHTTSSRKGTPWRYPRHCPTAPPLLLLLPPAVPMPYLLLSNAAGHAGTPAAAELYCCCWPRVPLATTATAVSASRALTQLLLNSIAVIGAFSAATTLHCCCWLLMSPAAPPPLPPLPAAR